jgi:hypothetical protein
VDTGNGSESFRQAVADLADARAALSRARPELTFEDEPAPRRLAPYATAVAAVVCGGGAAAPDAAGAEEDAEIGSGRFVLLFDPAGQPGWDGRYRVISYVRADLDPEMAADSLINAVGWSWLTEALEGRDAGYGNISGTVTTEVTQGFGGKQDEPMSTEFELRASWSPVVSDSGDPDLADHLAAWCDVICAAAGLPPPAPGVASLRPPRRRRRP